MLLITIISIILFIIGIRVYIFFNQKWKHTYWKRKGLKYIEPDGPYGNVKRLALRTISIGDILAEFYNHFKDAGLRHGGVYFGMKPAYIPVDPEIIKNIIQKDFSHFMNRGIDINEDRDPLEGHLFNLNGEKWRNLRTKLTPTFTSGKMKMMFSTMTSCTKGLIDVLNDNAKIQDPVDIKDVSSRFTTDIIGSVVYGIDCNSLKNPKNDFRTYGKKIFELPPPTFKQILKLYIPTWLFEKLGFNIKKTNPEIEDFFMGITKSSIKYRETNNIVRKDVLHLLLQLKNKGIVTDDDTIFAQRNSEDDGNFLTINQIAAQSYVFFFAGFETSATTMTFAFLELALNKDIQEKLRKEIVTVLEKYNNQITYEAIMEMTYLDKVIQETLRKHPPVPVTPRICNTPYKIPNTDFTIEAGTHVFFPIQGIHSDPEFYPEPEKFDPERFNESNKAKRPPCTFLAFGDGPRNCIGARFGLLQAKVGVVSVIRNFKLSVNKKTMLPIRYATNTSITAVDGDAWLDVTRIN